MMFDSIDGDVLFFGLRGRTADLPRPRSPRGTQLLYVRNGSEERMDINPKRPR